METLNLGDQLSDNDTAERNPSVEFNGHATC